MKVSNPPSVNVEAHLRSLRLIFFAMAFSVVMYAGVLQGIGRPSNQIPEGIKTGLQVLAGTSALIVLFMRFVKIAALMVPDVLISTTERLAKLRTCFLVCFVFCESVALYGLVIRFMGASLVIAAPFFAGSLILFALCFPRLPSDLDNSRQ